MELFLSFLKAFLCGGVICLIGQLLIDKTSLTPANILTCYVVAGVILGALGLYEPLVNWAGAGATVPLSGFGYNLAKGVKTAVEQKGLLGAFTGGVTAAAGGISAAVFFGWLAAVMFKPGDKS
ncbi:MAG: stage V sporulation protein AE [Clostridiales bacterium]|nr:stage V sporulation protein AE [Clostridiales bacterium]